MSSIAAWAAAVHPGSPAPPSPCTPLPSPNVVDLTTLGYTPIFINIPYMRSPPRAVPMSPKQQSTLRRLCSLANFRPHSKSVTGAGASSKKPEYARVPPPPPFANDIALMQFTDEGSTDAYTKRAMKAPGAAGVGVVHTDEKGYIWWDEDEDEEYEYDDVDMYDYKENDSCKNSTSQQCSALLAMDKVTRRPSSGLESLSTRDPLGARNIVEPSEEAAYPVVPGLSVLSVPSRARKAVGSAEKHLRKPEFLVDVAPFGPASWSTDKAKRRPAPLKIVSPVSSSKKPTNPALPSADLLAAEEPTKVHVVPSHVDDGSDWHHWPIPRGWPLPQLDSMTNQPSGLDLRMIFRAGISNIS